MILLVGSWGEVLSDIPFDYLDRCYLEAIRSHKGGFPLAASEIYTVWKANSESWAREEQAEMGPLGNPEPCDNPQCIGGFEIVTDENGQSKGARPCPKCNAKQAAQW